MKAQYEKVPSAQRSFFACRRVSREFRFNWHYHPEYELTLIEKGSGQRFVGDHTADYRPHDLVLLGPNLPHTWASAPDMDTRRATNSAIVVQFLTEHLGQDLLQLDEMKPLTDLFARSHGGLYFHSARSRHEGISRMRELLTLDGGRRTLALLSLLLDLAADTSALALSGSLVRPLCRVEEEKRMNKICLFLSSRSKDAVDYDELAELVCMERTALCRFFKRASGRTMSDYVNEIRLSEAMRLLSESDMSLLDISQTVGFQNYANFCRQFKSSKGANPRAVRQQFRSSPAPLHNFSN